MGKSWNFWSGESPPPPEISFEHNFFLKHYFWNSIKIILKNHNKLKVGTVITTVSVQILQFNNIFITQWKHCYMENNT